LKAKGKVIGVLEAINPVGREAFSSCDQELFECFSDQAAIAVENARLHEELVRQEKAKQELKIAHEIQQNFLPDLSEGSFGVDVAARNIPAREVGGDFYDVIRLDDSKTAVVVGDVSGKGVPAALYMVRAISDYRFLAPRCDSPARLLEWLNQGLVKDSRFGMFTTLLCLVVDRSRKVLRYASAGHHPILKRSASGRVEVLKNAGGVPLGLDRESKYAQAEEKISAGDAFFLYTDGILEARNRSGQEYALERFIRCVGPAGPSAQHYADRIVKDVTDFTQGADQHDDMTALALLVP
jgi:sigma-B regulation protein RsbU (phosphoserine phosphatase)